MSHYIHEREDWPRFRWSRERLAERLAAVRYRQGQLMGRMENLGFSIRAEATLESLALNIVKSSEIEGLILDWEQVRSSLARRLGLEIGSWVPASRSVEGAVEVMLDATQHYAEPLTRERLLGWHAALFPTGYAGMFKIRVGAFRDDAHGPMQVVSGPIGRERVHFEAPAAHRLEREMTAFLEWLNRNDGTDPVIRAGIAHLWFVTIHPFDDGNGRIARAIADMALARSERSPQRFYSLSAQILKERRAYYNHLEHTQRGTLDITAYLEWFLGCLDRALDAVEITLEAVLRKARFFEALGTHSLNERQRLIVNKLLDGFEGKLTSSKWAKLGKCSQDTALRDIQDLVERGILSKDAAGGRSTSYSLAEPQDTGLFEDPAPSW